MRKSWNVMVIDAQGVGGGRQLVEAIKTDCKNVMITTVGTSSVATAGENTVVVGCRGAEVIVGVEAVSTSELI